MQERIADWDDLPHTTWKCEACGAENSCLDGTCQFCDVADHATEQGQAEEEAIDAGRLFSYWPN